MKKVNLINKKVLSTGLVASLLMANLCANQCFADGGTASSTVVKETQRTNFKGRKTTSSKPRRKKAAPEQVSRPKLSLADSVNVNIPARPKLSLSEPANVDIPETKTTPSSEPTANIPGKETTKKTSMAVTAAKVVGTAAVLGTLAYLGYTYKDDIASIGQDCLKKAGDIASNLANDAKAAFEVAKKHTGSALNSTRNFASNTWDSVKSSTSTAFGAAKKGLNYLLNVFGLNNKIVDEEIIMEDTFGGRILPEEKCTALVERPSPLFYEPDLRKINLSSTNATGSSLGNERIIEFNPTLNVPAINKEAQENCTALVEGPSLLFYESDLRRTVLSPEHDDSFALVEVPSTQENCTAKKCVPNSLKKIAATVGIGGLLYKPTRKSSPTVLCAQGSESNEVSDTSKLSTPNETSTPSKSRKSSKPRNRKNNTNGLRGSARRPRIINQTQAQCKSNA